MDSMSFKNCSIGKPKPLPAIDKPIRAVVTFKDDKTIFDWTIPNIKTILEPDGRLTVIGKE